MPVAPEPHAQDDLSVPPATLAEALARTDADRWLAAYDAELNVMQTTKVFFAVQFS